MNRTGWATIGVLVLAIATVVAGAQMGMGRPAFPHGIFQPIVGAGAQYQMQSGNRPATTMEMAIVGKEAVDGKTGYWLEMTMSGMPMGEMVTKTLMISEGSTLTPSKIIMQMPGRPPMEMPAQMGRMGPQSEPTDIRSVADDLGQETVTTPAGVFSCEHYRMKDGSGETWISEKAPPFAMVKFQGKNSSMVLTKLITDAKDKITGTPQPFNPMQMTPGGPPSH